MGITDPSLPNCVASDKFHKLILAWDSQPYNENNNNYLIGLLQAQSKMTHVKCTTELGT